MDGEGGREGLLKRFFFVVGIYYLWKMSFEKHRNWISDETLPALKYSIFLVLLLFTYEYRVAVSKFNPPCMLHCITDEMASPRFLAFLQVYFLTWISRENPGSFRSFSPCVNVSWPIQLDTRIFDWIVFKHSSFISRWTNRRKSLNSILSKYSYRSRLN